MSGTWENVLKTAGLFYFTQSLKMWCIDEIPDVLGEVDKAVDVIINLSGIGWVFVVLSIMLSLLYHLLKWWALSYHVLINITVNY